jgi:MFS family permease
MRHPVPAIAKSATDICSMGLLNTVGVLQAWVSEHQLNGYSESNIGWIFSAYAFFLYIGGAQVGEYRISERPIYTRDLQPIQGPIFDAHDIRYLLVPGSVGIVTAIMCMSVSTGRLVLIMEELRLTHYRILSAVAILWHSWWLLCLSSIYTGSVRCWSLVL